MTHAQSSIAAPRPWVALATVLVVAAGCGGEPKVPEPDPALATAPPQPPTVKGSTPGLRDRNPGVQWSPDAVDLSTLPLSPSAVAIDPLELLPKDLPIDESDRATIVEYVRAMQPLLESLTSDHHDRRYHRELALKQQILDTGRTQLGWAALHAFTNYRGDHVSIRRNLLIVGAAVSPEAARPILRELSFTYGHPLSDRAEAVLLLGDVSPEDFFLHARPYLERPGRPFQTAPPDEFFLRGWLRACKASGTSPVPMLAQVATNFTLEDAARHLAVETLGDHAQDPLARSALETTLVESSGNAYVRRKAAQSILKGYGLEEACTLLNAVYELEADINFQRFLDVAIQENCK